MRSRTVLRLGQGILRLLLIAWIAFGLWDGGRNVLDLHALSREGRATTAQVIGCDTVLPGSTNGNVHYAFNTGSIAIENHFVVPVSEYKNFPIGRPIPVTYLPTRPHIMRIGSVENRQVLGSGLLSMLFLIAGLIAFGLPLLGIQASLQRRPSQSIPSST